MKQTSTDSKLRETRDPHTGLDPFQIRIQQEVEEFLRDLTLEYPFSEIFETLRRHEFKDRFGKNVTPMPQKRFSSEVLSEIDERISSFLVDLRKVFGSRYSAFIDDSFRYYTETTLE
ncbi:MAG: hypothetical protein J0L93_05705 [Deltaproteobacteria bacterium]|nr:hypothetical protein [Deltaproteobacteria bacterium]